MRELKGRRVLITGAARRIGRDIAVELARAGADVAITFNTSAREARRVVTELSGHKVRGFAFHCDIRDEVSVKAMIAECRRELGGIDILVNNAAIYDTADFAKITLRQWDNIFATNTRGAFLVSREALKELRKGDGRIINLGSLGGLKAWADHAHYCASKAALHMLTLAMAKALAPEISVNCVAPGVIPFGAKNAEITGLIKATPMKRGGEGSEVARAVKFFATSPKFITGQILAVDGGVSLR